MSVSTGSFSAPKPAPVHFREAIDFLRTKIRLPTRAYTDLWRDQHARAFVVAGAMKDALVADFHEAVTRAIAEGRTLEDFRKDFDRIVATHGWSYRGGRDWRSRIIFDTNLRTAYSAGRWGQAVRLAKSGQKVYLRYVAILDKKTRPQHAAWHGLILPIEHPFWETFLPPNAWNCRCTFQIVREPDLKRFGWKVTPDDQIPWPENVTRTINTPDGPVSMEVPEGLDPGFDYNPGMGAFGRGANLTEIERHGGFVDLEAPSSARSSAGELEPVTTSTRPSPVPPLENGMPNEQALKDLFQAAIGGNEAVFIDPTGNATSITEAVVDHLVAKPTAANTARAAYWPFIRELIERPQEIWVGFARDEATGKVALRRRYVRLVQLGRDRVIALVADEQKGYWQTLTFFVGRPGSDLGNLRRGVLAYKA